VGKRDITCAMRGVPSISVVRFEPTIAVLDLCGAESIETHGLWIKGTDYAG
jgi:hypothetical protein